MPMVNAYGSDLAYIHDVGFGHFARSAAPGLLKLIRQGRKVRGLVVDLGCGSGIWARELCSAGYDVLGIDISDAMITLARKRAPKAEFRRASFLTAEIPPCAAVTAMGECFSYLFDASNTKRGLSSLFRRVHEVLQPGGLLIFDVAAPGRVPGPGPQRSYREGDDWVVLVAAQEDHKLLTRRITIFRRAESFIDATTRCTGYGCSKGRSWRSNSGTWAFVFACLRVMGGCGFHPATSASWRGSPDPRGNLRVIRGKCLRRYL